MIPILFRLLLNYVLTKTDGQLYGLINNAAYGVTGAVEDLPAKALRDQFETNVFGTQELTNLIIPVMRKQKSRQDNSDQFSTWFCHHAVSRRLLRIQICTGSVKRCDAL